jgi:3,4-dihydroxy-2-butanone 4-phosphate synthase
LLCGAKPAGVICEIMNEDGTMARVPQLRIIADKLNVKMITIKDLVAYRIKKDNLVKREV